MKAIILVALLGVFRVSAYTNSSLVPANPTHYGPSYPMGQCRPDEAQMGLHGRTHWICLPYGVDCTNDQDCPQDKPPGMTVETKCYAKEGAVCRGAHEECCDLYPCSADEECGLGGTCVENMCGYDQSTDCYYIAAVTGRWHQIQSSPYEQSVSFQEGVTRSHTVTASGEWGAKVTSTTKAGFSAFGVKGSETISGEISASLSIGYSSTFSMSSVETHTFDFPAGVVWQWMFDVQDGCGPTSVSGHDLELTPNSLVPPCCLPGFFANITEPLGQCIGGTPSLCNQSSVTIV